MLGNLRVRRALTASLRMKCRPCFDVAHLRRGRSGSVRRLCRKTVKHIGKADLSDGAGRYRFRMGSVGNAPRRRRQGAVTALRPGRPPRLGAPPARNGNCGASYLLRYTKRELAKSLNVVHLKVLRVEPLNSHACRFVAVLLADALKFPADRRPVEFPLTLIRAPVVGLPTGKANAHRAIGIEVPVGLNQGVRKVSPDPNLPFFPLTMLASSSGPISAATALPALIAMSVAIIARSLFILVSPVTGEHLMKPRRTMRDRLHSLFRH